MPMSYANSAISETEVPRAVQPVFQHLLDTYASETSKVISVWRQFSDEDLSFRPHARSSTVLDIFKHQLLSERRFFGEFMGLPEPAASEVLAHLDKRGDWARRLLELARPRLTFLAMQSGVLVAGASSLFRCGARTNLDFLAASSAYCASSHPADRLFAIVRETGSGDLWAYGRCHLGRGRPDSQCRCCHAASNFILSGYWKPEAHRDGRHLQLVRLFAKNAWIPVPAVCDGRAGLGLLAHGNPRNLESLAPRCIAQDGPTGLRPGHER